MESWGPYILIYLPYIYLIASFFLGGGLLVRLPCRRAAALLGTLAANRLTPPEGRDARGKAWRWERWEGGGHQPIGSRLRGILGRAKCGDAWQQTRSFDKFCGCWGVLSSHVFFFLWGKETLNISRNFWEALLSKGQTSWGSSIFFWWCSCDVLGEHNSNAWGWTQLVLVAAVVLNLGSRVAQHCSVWWGWQEALYEETLIKHYQWGTVLLHFGLNNGPSIVKLCFGIGKPSISNFWWMWWI